MDDSFLMRVLYRVADLNEQLQTRIRRQGMSVTIIGDFDTIDKFHHKIRPPMLGCAGIEDVSNVRMIHQRERLTLSLEARDHAFRVHSRLNHLEGDTTANRFLLLCYENHTATSFSDLLQQLVPIHAVTRLFPSGGFRPAFAYHLWR